MNTQQTTPEIPANNTLEFTVVSPQPDVDTLLARLPAATAAAVAAHSVPVEELKAITVALGKEMGLRYKTVRGNVVAVLEEHRMASIRELVATAFDDVPEVDANSPLLELVMPSPFPDPVDGLQLLDELRNEFRRYLSLPNHSAETVALWVIHTFAHDLADKSPILAVTSPTKRCGKTTMLTLLETLCARPVGSSNLTPAIMFRLIDAEKPTLLIDEADTFLRDNQELRGVLNSGFSRGAMAVILRVVNGRTTRFSTWAPKAIACIGKLPDTLHDRAIEVRMQRKRAHERLARMRDTDPETFVVLTSKIWRWVTDKTVSLRAARPEIPSVLDDRACDKWTPLLAIADIAGGHWPTTARAAATALSITTEGRDDSKPAMLLADLRDIFAMGGARQLTTKEILNRLASIDDRP